VHQAQILWHQCQTTPPSNARTAARSTHSFNSPGGPCIKHTSFAPSAIPIAACWEASSLRLRGVQGGGSEIKRGGVRPKHTSTTAAPGQGSPPSFNVWSEKKQVGFWGARKTNIYDCSTWAVISFVQSVKWKEKGWISVLKVPKKAHIKDWHKIRLFSILGMKAMMRARKQERSTLSLLQAHSARQRLWPLRRALRIIFGSHSQLLEQLKQLHVKCYMLNSLAELEYPFNIIMR